MGEEENITSAPSSPRLAARRVSMLVVLAMERRPWVRAMAEVVGRTIAEVVETEEETVAWGEEEQEQEEEQEKEEEETVAKGKNVRLKLQRDEIRKPVIIGYSQASRQHVLKRGTLHKEQRAKALGWRAQAAVYRPCRCRGAPAAAAAGARGRGRGRAQGARPGSGGGRAPRAWRAARRTGCPPPPTAPGAAGNPP